MRGFWDFARTHPIPAFLMFLFLMLCIADVADACAGKKHEASGCGVRVYVGPNDGGVQ